MSVQTNRNNNNNTTETHPSSFQAGHSEALVQEAQFAVNIPNRDEMNKNASNNEDNNTNGNDNNAAVGTENYGNINQNSQMAMGAAFPNNNYNFNNFHNFHNNNNFYPPWMFMPGQVPDSDNNPNNPNNGHPYMSPHPQNQYFYDNNCFYPPWMCMPGFVPHNHYYSPNYGYVPFMYHHQAANGNNPNFFNNGYSPSTFARMHPYSVQNNNNFNDSNYDQTVFNNNNNNQNFPSNYMPQQAQYNEYSNFSNNRYPCPQNQYFSNNGCPYYPNPFNNNNFYPPWMGMPGFAPNNSNFLNNGYAPSMYHHQVPSSYNPYNGYSPSMYHHQVPSSYNPNYNGYSPSMYRPRGFNGGYNNHNSYTNNPTARWNYHNSASSQDDTSDSSSDISDIDEEHDPSLPQDDFDDIISLPPLWDEDFNWNSILEDSPDADDDDDASSDDESIFNDGLLSGYPVRPTDFATQIALMRSILLEGNNGLSEGEIFQACSSRDPLSAEEECVICWDDGIDENDVGIVSLRCGHPFHRGCIRKWLLEHADCPMCRRNCGSPSQRRVSFRYFHLFSGSRSVEVPLLSRS